MMGGIGDVGKIPELRKRILFTLSMLAVYRFGVFVSTPGIDVEAIRRMFAEAEAPLLGFVNLFSGGALERFSIFSLGIAPYISVSIIIQMLTPTVPALERLKKEGESGQRILTRYTRWGTMALALIQGYMVAVGLEASGLTLQSGLSFQIMTALTLAAGTAFIMWLGEQITERGIGNGISIVIFAGIIAQMPMVLGETLTLSRTGEISPLSVLFLIAFTVLTIAAIVFIERSHRRIPVQYPRRMVGKNMAQAQTQYMPLKLNMAGVYPPIFASALLVVPSTVASLGGSEVVQDIMAYLNFGSWTYNVVFVGLMVVFSFFFTAVIFNPQDIAENLKKNGGFIPTVRPGKETADFLYGVLNRLTLWGAIYLAIICVVPQIIYFNIGTPSFAQVFGGTSILIVVGVTLDTISQIDSHIVARNYEAFMSRSTKVRGGVGSMSYLRARVLKR